MTSGPRVVYDCNVFFQGLIRPGPASRCMDLIELRRVDLLQSDATLAEARDVLNRPWLRRKHPELTDRRVDRLFEVLGEFGTLLDVPGGTIRLSRDPKDVAYLELALAGQAKYLVTRDKDLLTILSDTSSEGAAIRRLLPELQIVEPQVFIQNFST